MKLGQLGIRLEGVWRQTSVEKEFEPFSEARLKATSHGVHAWAVTLTSRRSEEPLAAVRVRLFVPAEDASTALIRHPALVRMRNVGQVPSTADWTLGARSELAAETHFEQRPGEPPFGLPPFLTIDAGPWRFLVGALTENRARISMTWHAADGGVLVELEWRRQGRPSYPVSRHWPHERFWVQWGMNPAVPNDDPLAQAALERHRQRLRDHSHPDAALAQFEKQRVEHLEARFAEPYRRAVRASLMHFRPTGPMVRGDLIWGSWNDGIYRDIDEDRILETARWLKENAPAVRWIQIDDGWAPGGDPAAMSHFGRFFELGSWEADARFPDGLGGIARKIKELGLRPMIWLTPAVHEDCRLFNEKPEWFQPDTRLYFMPELRFLDTSVSEARGFVESVFRTVFNDWGFEGCKLDFWTMGFDQPDIAYRDSEADGVSELRRFVQMLRRHLPPDGLLLHCIDLPFGSPFRSPGFDAFRYYADSEGSCQSFAKMKEQALWAAYLVGNYQVQHHWIPDGDGMGLFRHFEMPDGHFELWLAFLVGSGTFVELAGWLGAGQGDPRRDLILSALPFVRHGAPIAIPGFDFGQTDGEPPRIWIRRDGFTRTILALTNWSEEPFNFVLEDYGVRCATCQDVFANESLASPRSIWVRPQSGKLLILN